MNQQSTLRYFSPSPQNILFENIENNYFGSMFDEPQRLSGFERFKDFVLRQLDNAGFTARRIGLSALESAKDVVNSLISIIAPAFGTTFKWIVDLIKRILESIMDKLWNFANQHINDFRSLVCACVATIMACLAIVLPRSRISTMGRVLFAALAAMVAYTKSYFSLGLATGLTYLLTKFGSQVALDVQVDNHIHPQGFKEDTTSTIMNLVTLSIVINAGVSGLALPTDAKSWDDLLKRHSLLHRTYSAWSFGAEKISQIFEDTTRYVMKYFFGKEFVSFEHVAEVEELYDSVIELTRLDVNVDIGRDPKLAAKIECLYAQYLNLLRVYNKNKEITTKLCRIGTPLLEFYRKVTDKNPKAHVMRKEPVCVVLWGPTGVGKSYLMNRLQQDLLKISGKFDPNRPMEGMIYSRCIEQDYWDGYTGQPICIMDDFAQLVDSPVKPNLEFFEVIRSVNIFPYQLHSAALHEKANSPFTSDFLILTTNLTNFQPKSIISDEAFKRRLHLSFQLSLIKEVQEPSAKETRLCPTRLAEYQKKNNLPSYDMSHIRFVDDYDGLLTYDEIVVKISLIYKKHMEAFTRRQQNNQETAPFPLPTGCYTVDPQWTPPVPQMMQDWEDEERFVAEGEARDEEQQRVADQEDESDSDDSGYHELPALRLRGVLLNGPQRLNRILRERLAERNRALQEYQAAYDLYRARRMQDNIAWYVRIWKDMEELRAEWSERYRPFVRYFSRFTIILMAGIAITATMKQWFGTSKIVNKGPIVNTLVKSALTNVALGLSSESPMLFYPTLAGVTVGMLTTVVRDILYHAVYHQVFNVDCPTCNKHLEIVKNVKPSECTTPLPELLAEFESAHRPQVKPVAKFEDDGTYEMDFGIEHPLYPYVKMHQYIKDHYKGRSDLTNEQQLEILDVVKKAREERKQFLRGAKTDVESSMKVPAKTPVVKYESELKDLFPSLYESGRSADDSKKKKIVLEGIRCQQTENLKNMLRRNIWLCATRIDGVVHDVGFITVIKGHKALINYHYLQVISKEFSECLEKDKFEIFFHQPNMAGGHVGDLKSIVLNAIPIHRGQHQTEFYLITLPKTMQLGRDLTHHLIDPKKASSLARGVPLQLVTMRKDSNEKWTPFTVAGPLERISAVCLPDLCIPDKQHMYLESVYYGAPTKGGDCGNPIVIDSNEFPKKILGFHFAGQQGRGICSVITYADLEPYVKDESALADPEHISLREVEDFPLENSSFYVQGAPVYKISHPTKSCIEPSLVHGLFGPPKMRPAILAPPLKPDGPMLKALMKNAGDMFPLTDSHIFADIKTDYFNTCIAPFTPTGNEQKILTFKQACMGIEGDQFFPPIKRGKSAGYPYMAQATKGKIDWFGSEEWDFSSEQCKQLKIDVHKMTNDARLGIVPEAIFVATLKDEKRLNEKVDACKTRSFSACPMHYLIAFRQYFAGFIAFMARNRIGNESAIGTNAHGYDWKEIVRHLTPWENEQSIAAGDFENFDGSFHPELFDEVCDVINMFYMDGAENAKIRRNLWKALTNPMHILDRFIFTFSHGQPSGSPITALSNSIYLSLAIRYIMYSFLKENKLTFKNHIRFLAYGDDTLISISPLLSKLIRQYDIAQLFKNKLRMTYTSASKQAIVPDDEYQTIAEVTFLKRGFKYDSALCHWFAPLDLVSIEEMCNWIKKGPSDVQATIENCNDAMKELCHHEHSVFTEYTEKICDASRPLGLMVCIPDWNRVRFQMSMGQIDYLSEGRPFV
ncbi:MAG: replicase polyprotein [Ljubljana dicistrovirus 1]|nr:MAG: replicase polyprotein [Ljubljana dicistrovirus 1]